MIDNYYDDHSFRYYYQNVLQEVIYTLFGGQQNIDVMRLAVAFKKNLMSEGSVAGSKLYDSKKQYYLSQDLDAVFTRVLQ